MIYVSILIIESIYSTVVGMDGEARYLSAGRAAEELGVSLQTLYAYVSRGMVRSEAVEGKRRNRRYRAEDVRRLKERK
jgi:citrate synthase